MGITTFYANRKSRGVNANSTRYLPGISGKVSTWRGRILPLLMCSVLLAGCDMNFTSGKKKPESPKPAPPDSIVNNDDDDGEFGVRPDHEALQQAVAMYPDLQVKDTPMNRAFVAAVKNARKNKLPVMQQPIWPVILAKQAGAQLAVPARSTNISVSK